MHSQRKPVVCSFIYYQKSRMDQPGIEVGVLVDRRATKRLSHGMGLKRKLS